MISQDSSCELSYFLKNKQWNPANITADTSGGGFSCHFMRIIFNKIVISSWIRYYKETKRHCFFNSEWCLYKLKKKDFVYYHFFVLAFFEWNRKCFCFSAFLMGLLTGGNNDFKLFKLCSTWGHEVGQNFPFNGLHFPNYTVALCHVFYSGVQWIGT